MIPSSDIPVPPFRNRLGSQQEAWPRQPTAAQQNAGCPIRTQYKVFNACKQNYRRRETGKTLYPKYPNMYPSTYVYEPINSLYGEDNSQFDALGNRLSYHFKSFPLTHHHVREVPSVRGDVIDSRLIDTRYLQRQTTVQGGIPKYLR